MKKSSFKHAYMWAAFVFALVTVVIICAFISGRKPINARQASPSYEPFVDEQEKTNIRFAPEAKTDLYWEVPDFLTPEECDQLKKHAIEKGLEQSMVLSDDNSNIPDTRRTSEQVWFNTKENNTILEKIRKKSMELSGKPMSHFEDIQVVRYGMHGRYDPHYDSCNKTDTQKCHSDNPRKMTVLIYLNDDFECGGTTFPRLNKTVKPKKGKALVFLVSDDDGFLYENALHGGDPVCNGEKWIATQWIHVKPYQ